MKYATKVIYAISNVFNSRNKRMDKVDRTIEKVVHETEKPWPTSTQIEPCHSSVHELNDKMLPSNLFEYSKDQAYRFNNASPEFVVSPILACASALIGTSCKITPKQYDKKWSVGQALWCLNIAEPSNLKSPTLKVGIQLLKLAQNEVINPNNLIRANDALIKEKKAAALFAQANEAMDVNDEESAKILLEQAEKIKNSIEPQRDVIINDCTTEALLVHLKSNPNGCLVVRDEIHGWLSKIMQSENTNDKSIYTEGFDGNNSYIQKRISRAPVQIDEMHIGILGSIQPDMLKPLLKGRSNGISNDGFYERFQLSTIAQLHGTYTDTVPTEGLQKNWEHIFCCLASIKENNIKICANFTLEAQLIWNKWAEKQVEDTVKADSKMQSVMGKHPSLVAKLSLIFQLMTDAESCTEYKTFLPSHEVSCSSLNQAISFSELLLSHNRSIQEFISKTNDSSTINQLISKLERLPTQFSLRELQRKGWTGLITAAQCRTVLQQLEAKGYIRKINLAQQGKKSMERFLKNPNIS